VRPRPVLGAMVRRADRWLALMLVGSDLLKPTRGSVVLLQSPHEFAAWAARTRRTLPMKLLVRAVR
jgi:hypothetical protein